VSKERKKERKKKRKKERVLDLTSRAIQMKKNSKIDSDADNLSRVQKGCCFRVFGCCCCCLLLLWLHLKGEMYKKVDGESS